MKRRKLGVIGFVALLAGVTFVLGAFALSNASDTYLSDFEAQYPAAVGTRIDSCLMCHNVIPGSSARNAYGAAWASNGHNFTANNFEQADSDGDGFTNLAEITARFFPGNAADHPATGDTTLPTVTNFAIPATATSLTISVTTFTASDNVLVTGYLVNESATKPLASAAGWSATAPTSFTFSTAGSKTLFAWAKDAAGNVSASVSDSTIITLATPVIPFDGSGDGGSGCFIATAAFGSYVSPYVRVLRNFRDTFLMTSRVGRAFVTWYYRVSPPIADTIAQRSVARAVIRAGLLPLIGFSAIALAIGLIPTLFMCLLFLAGIVIGAIKMQSLRRTLRVV